ncbi:MAG: NAD(P)H-hydrate dehydratase [Ruminococcaceae bacterium]|nr:NAD(P)H-hydrate dehydratase [Oscillospiraceae bacterium]
MNTYTQFSFSTFPSELMPKRKERSSKGDYGRILCVCGSVGMSGAAYLCAKACYRTGAGLVEIFTPEENRAILQSALPEAIITAYTEDNATELLLTSLEKANCVIAGCGLSVTPLSRKILSILLHNVNAEKTPLILDADALNLISRNPSFLRYIAGAIITPHPLEFSRLSGNSVSDILECPAPLAYEYAKKYSLICVLKDHNTIVTDGSDRLYINNTGNSGMATAGSGDVLAGIIAGLMAQNKEASLDIASLGVYIHGLCGDIAARHLSEYSLMASDIIDALPVVFSSI